ncbi:MAG: GIY-YIG nuclease family protein [Bacteroidetes bacterium]|nr:GIY-YIG nuclease family protein [Bacteroidota bacterium]
MKTKKENKEVFKNTKFRIGIFQIKNKKDNKLFLNTSIDLDRAYNSHKFQLNNWLHPNKALQTDWEKLGSDNFVFIVIDELITDDTMTEMKIKSDLKELLEMHRDELLKKEVSLY